MEESYLSFLGSYPFSSPPHHQGEEDHHVIPRPNGTPSSGLMSPDMEVPAAAPPNGTSNNCTAKKSSSACREEIGKVKQMKRVPAKKPRYAFETRSHVDLLDDGYRWRKYGQKAVKNNKFPRSYYRCTFEGCNVKKQVQRLTGDEGVVVTTYEGVHSHAIEKSNDNFEHILKQFKLYS